MHWIQTYDPFGSPVLSTPVAALPIVLLLGLLATGRVSAQLAALIGLVAAMLAAIFAFMPESLGGVMGKMIDAQSIVVSAAATQQPGQEGAILRFVFWHSLILAVLMGLLVMIQAYLWSGIIP